MDSPIVTCDMMSVSVGTIPMLMYSCLIPINTPAYVRNSMFTNDPILMHFSEEEEEEEVEEEV